MSQNLLKRIVTSIILLLLLFFINFAHQYVFIIAILTLGIIICIEANNLFLKLFRKNFKKNLFFDKYSSKFFILNIITFCYIFFIFCGFSYEIHKTEGPIFFLYIVGICFFTDIGGYVVGKAVGGKKLSKISPNKTISGTFGSFLFSLIPLIFFLNIVYLDLKINFSNILYCLLISLVSQLGDLFVSFLKRKAKIKDTGKILPGHGGVLDRLDGIIFAVPFSYLLLKLI
jgi:phosphatidate cytidylyltransferase